jgi:predicted RND superfamily exporter protein
MLLLFAGWVARRPRSILLGALLVALGVGLGATRIVVDTNPMSFYRQTEPIWRSTHLLNEHLGGWAGVSVVAEGDIKDPKVLKQIDDLEQHLKKHPLVGTTTSIAGAMRWMNRVMHDGDKKYDRVPQTRELVAQYLLLYSMSGDQEDFEKLVDFPYRHAQIMAKVTDSGTRAATEVLNYTRAYVTAHRGGPLRLVGGFLDVMADMVHHIVWGQLMSIALAGLLVCALVSLLMRSVVAGLLSAFPLVLALAMIFGVMGLFGIELNLVTALLSSIMIGVGIDYSIHFLWRYRDERRGGLAPEKAVERTLATTGRGIVFNALSVVVGFAVLVISAFFPVRFFGVLVAISILASLAGALIVLPALVVVLRPRYFEPS